MPQGGGDLQSVAGLAFAIDCAKLRAKEKISEETLENIRTLGQNSLRTLRGSSEKAVCGGK